MSLGKAAPEGTGTGIRQPAAVRRVKVDPEAAGQRIDNYLLAYCKGVPRSHVYRILRSGEVRVNGGRVAPTYRLAEGDELRIPPIRIAARDHAIAGAPARDFPVVFEDESLLVIDKPAGVAVHGGSGVSFGVIEQLRANRPQARMLELVHRLDRETSGLLIVAKRRAALTAMQDMLREGGMEKRYLTMVSGRWMNPVQHVRVPLLKYLTDDGERRVAVSREGKPSHSIVRLQARWERYSLVEVQLMTGRTHQIRVHLQSLGYPLLGDDKYGDFALNKQLAREGLARMFLHAASLAFRHPLTQQHVQLNAPLPDVLQTFIGHVSATQKKEYPSDDAAV